MVPRPEPKPNPDEYATVQRRIVLELTDRDNEWLQAVVEAAGSDPGADGEEIGLAMIVVNQLRGLRHDWTPERGLHTVPFNDGSGLYDRVKCPQCLGTGGPSTGPVCDLCAGSGHINAVIAEQMARMSAS